jgi:hypothetical protein
MNTVNIFNQAGGPAAPPNRQPLARAHHFICVPALLPL